MSREFEGDGNEADGSRGTVTRRSVLNGALTAGMGIASVGGYTSIADAREATEHVEEKDGRSRRSVLGRALSDADTKQVRRQFIENGWRPRVGDATVLLTDDPENSVRYHTVTIPFETGSEDEQAILLWTDSSLFPVQGRHFVHIEGRTWRETSYWVEEGTLETQTSEFDVDTAATAGDVQIQAWCWPWDIHWACVLAIAGAFAGTYASCAACVADVTRITCLGCISAVLGGGATIGFCTWCG